MKVLLIGGTGTISTACTQLAVQKGFDVYLLNRGKRGVDTPPGVKILNADINNFDETAAALAGHTWDVVANFIGYVPINIERDIQHFTGKTGQYIFVSSCVVYQHPPVNYLVTESAPQSNPHWQYAVDKIACEELLMTEYRKTGFPVTIVRPSWTYDHRVIPIPINSWQHPWSVADRMLRGLPVIVHGDGESLWQMTHNTDFAKGFVGLLGHPQSLGHGYHITSDEVLTWNQIYRLLAAALGVEAKLVHLPTDMIVAHEPGYRGGLLGDKAYSVVLDNTKIKRAVPDYVATTSFAQGIRKSVAWYRADKARQTSDPAFHAMCDRLLAAWQRAMPER